MLEYLRNRGKKVHDSATIKVRTGKILEYSGKQGEKEHDSAKFKVRPGRTLEFLRDCNTVHKRRGKTGLPLSPMGRQGGNTDHYYAGIHEKSTRKANNSNWDTQTNHPKTTLCHKQADQKKGKTPPPEGFEPGTNTTKVKVTSPIPLRYTSSTAKGNKPKSNDQRKHR